MERKRTFGFLIDRETWADHPAIVAKVMAREIGPETTRPYPLNPSTDGEHASNHYPCSKRVHGLDFADLEIHAVWGGAPGDPYLTVRVWYKDRHMAEASNVRRMAKTLDKIEKAIAKAMASEAGDVLMAVAKAVDAEWLVERRGAEGDSSRFRCDDKWYWRDSITDARDKFRREIEAVRPRQQVAA